MHDLGKRCRLCLHQLIGSSASLRRWRKSAYAAIKPTIGDYMNSYIDMHIHTTYSDGTLTPSEILERSLEIGLKAISITDHNTINGVTEAMKYANSAIEIIPGIEMTATYPKPLHILGYYIDIHSASFNDGIKTLRMQKYKWLLMLVRNLKK